MMRQFLTGLLVMPFLAAGCARVLEEPRLSAQGDRSVQETVDVKITPLIAADIAKLNATPFVRQVQLARAGQVRPVPEAALMRVTAPVSTKPIPYKIGVGDVLSITRLISKIELTDTSAQESQSVVSNQSQVTADGNIQFIETGVLPVNGRTIAQVRDLVSNALIKNRLDQRFQLEVSGFNSQVVSLALISAGAGNAGENTDGAKLLGGTALYPITERPLSLRELLVRAGAEINRSFVQTVTLQRAGRAYSMPIDHVFSVDAPEYYLTGGDSIKLEGHAYKGQVAYVLGGGSSPQTVPVSPASRPTLSDALFGDDGPMASPAARKWEVYLLRGANPVNAYHLDATDPARLTLSNQLELRPDDIVFVATKPIYDLNRLISLINPVYTFANALSGD